MTIDVASTFGARTRLPLVDLRFGGEMDGHKPIQMDPEEARRIARLLIECAESAEQDAFLFHHFTTEVGLSEEKAAAVLVMFRKWRDARPKPVDPGIHPTPPVPWSEA